MVRFLDPEASKVLELPSPPRYLGWTQEQWALAAGQAPRKYNATPEDAFRLRVDWLNSMQVLDIMRLDRGFAGELFYRLAERG